MQEIPITFQSQGKQIVGIIHQPEKENDIAVIMCHGFTGDKTENKRLFVETGRAFAEAGFLTLRFDFFGSGDSEGGFFETRLSHNIQNLRDAMQFFRNRGVQKIVVLGISMGAATAILTFKPDEMDGLILWSSVADLRKLFESKLGKSLETAPAFESYEYEGWLIEREFYLDALQYDISECLKTIDIPKLIVQGSNDDTVFIEGYTHFKTIAQKPVDFLWIEDAGHTYETVKHRKEVIQRTLEWLITQTSDKLPKFGKLRKFLKLNL